MRTASGTVPSKPGPLVVHVLEPPVNHGPHVELGITAHGRLYRQLDRAFCVDDAGLATAVIPEISLCARIVKSRRYALFSTK